MFSRWGHLIVSDIELSGTVTAYTGGALRGPDGMFIG